MNFVYVNCNSYRLIIKEKNMTYVHSTWIIKWVGRVLSLEAGILSKLIFFLFVKIGDEVRRFIIIYILLSHQLS